MEQKIRIGAVSYLNTKPMITGLEKWDKIELILDYPSNVARMLLENKIDIGLVPVAVIPLMKEHYLVSNYGIACNGTVASVCLFSEVPIEEIETIYLDYQSKTSVQLLKILLKEFWGKKVNFINGEIGFETKVNGTTAALVIGDRAFELREKHTYSYDLGEVWKKHTSLPFVFATWVSNKKIDDGFLVQFNKIITTNLSSYFNSLEFLNLSNSKKDYLQNIIKYQLNDDYKKAMAVFLEKFSTDTLLPFL